MLAAEKMQRLAGLPNGFDVRDITATAAERAVAALRSGMILTAAASQRSLGSLTDDDAASAVLQLFADNPGRPDIIA